MARHRRSSQPDIQLERLQKKHARLDARVEELSGRTFLTATEQMERQRLKKEKQHPWRNRAHFCAIAANAMREILVERARARAAKKRGGSRARVSYKDDIASEREQSFDLLSLHETMERLEEQDPRLARVVELRFFGGLTVEETAGVMNVSPVTVKRAWSMAKAWLKREMKKDGES